MQPATAMSTLALGSLCRVQRHAHFAPRVRPYRILDQAGRPRAASGHSMRGQLSR
jgi:hypothetical protein